MWKLNSVLSSFDRNQAPHWKQISIFALLSFVVFVSAYDMYWAIRLSDYLYEAELNPVGRWLMQIDDGRVALFMSLKMVGTVAVVSLSTWLCMNRFYLGFTVCSVLALFQGCLLLFLEYGHLLL